ncbi:MAG TPA: hypothetical protein VK814_11240 [Acidobacteriaceae bacterium]|jgi:hypothetical protein|nr:hypothetical protein [Acidobacteriaceae bacterium]
MIILFDRVGLDVTNALAAGAVARAELNACRDELLAMTFCGVTVLLVAWPILRFLYRPWIFRKELIFGAVSGDAAVYYYQQFRPGADILKKTPPEKLPERVGGNWYPTTTQDAYFAAFEKDFFKWYGRRYYVAPVAMLIILTTVSACWAQRMLREWAGTGVGPGTTLRALSASALAGAFVWVISDEIDRLRKRDFTTSDVYYYVFRILLAIPFAWAIAAVSINGSPLGLPGSIPLAFFLGAFPTNTLFKIARRFGAQTLKLGDDQTSGTLELERLQSIGKSNAERFQDEGITTIVALAYTDPVDLTIRTNFDFSYVVDGVSQALAWIYFQDDSAKLIELSMRGAQEISVVIQWSADFTDSVKQACADQAIFDAASKLGLSDKTLRTTFAQIVEDPYTEFLVNVWCAS